MVWRSAVPSGFHTLPKLKITSGTWFLVTLVLPGRRPPLDLSLDFILSGEGAFVRTALVSDLKVAAASFVLKRVPRVLRRKRRRRSRGGATAPSALPISFSPKRGTQRPKQPSGFSEDRRKDHSDFEADLQRNGDEDPAGRPAQAGRDARAASRKLLRRRALRGARRRPVLVVRVAGAVLAAAGRGVGEVRD